MTVEILHGDCLARMAEMPEASIDAVVTDPPYGIGFMGKEWDTFTPGKEEARIVPNRQIESDNPNLKGRTRGPASSPSAVEYDYSRKGLVAFQFWTEQWGREALRVLKPGGHILVCGAPRAYHRMACGLEDAGFEIRDCLAWLFGQGFPKSLNLGEGLGTALKPAHEPIVLARKPFKGSVTANVQQHGTGALNIDACRIEGELGGDPNRFQNMNGGWKSQPYGNQVVRDSGRWPANVVIDDLAAAVLDEMSGELRTGAPGFTEARGYEGGWGPRQIEPYGDVGGCSRFFYCAKPSREERDYGCESLPQKTAAELTGRKPGSAGLQNPRAGIRAGSSNRDIAARVARNSHPTVKPVELMRWLVRLITPINGTVLDPFMGSGTTGMACRYELRNFIGIEREQEYIQIAERRIAAVAPLFGASA